jgi:hypothetical protein
MEVFPMNRNAFKPLLIVSLLLALVALPAPRAVADDETDAVAFKVEAPLEASDCEGTPSTITLMGLTIDVTNAKFKVGSGTEFGTCADLFFGQLVEVKLANDTPDATKGSFVAMKVVAGDEMAEDMEELEDGEAAEIDARLEAFDMGANTITVLSQVIDISQAKIEGLKDRDDEDEMDDDADEAEAADDEFDLSHLAMGQFVEVKLASAALPLSASEVDVKNFENQIEVKLLDEDGEEVEDDAEDVEIDVKEMVKVKDAKGHVHKKIMKFHSTSDGSFTLRGLPTGKAKIFVKRDNGGKEGKADRVVMVKGNKTKRISMHLH